MQKIHPCLWFDGQAEEAANFYTSIFKDSKIIEVMRAGEGGPDPSAPVMVVNFQIEGQDFMALNGGPEFNFTEAISLVVDCGDQAEVDELWDRLTTDGGEPGECAWLKDKFGVSWQIVPRVLNELLADPDREKAGRVMQAMLQMQKIDIDALQRAHAGD